MSPSAWRSAGAAVPPGRGRAASRWALAGALVLGVGAAALGLLGRRETPLFPRYSAREAEARALAAAAEAEQDPDLALRLARAAVETAPTVEARSALYRLLEGRGPRRFPAHAGSVSAACFAPDGRSVLSASRDGDARLWSLDGTSQAVLVGHRAGVTACAFAPDGRSVVTGSADGTARVFGVDGALHAVLRGAGDDLVSAAFAPDGGLVLSVSRDRRARLHRPSGELVATLEAPGDVDEARWSPDGQRVLSLSREGPVRLWDRSGALAAQFAGGEGGVLEARLSPAGDRVLTRSASAEARLWDVQGRDVALLAGHGAPLLALAFAPDGQRLATASLDGTARIWSAEGRPLAVLTGHGAPVCAADFSSDGGRLLTLSSTGDARLWSASGEALAVLAPTGAPIRSALLTPDGQSVVSTSSAEPGVRLWSGDGHPLAVLARGLGRVHEARVSPDGAWLLAIGERLELDVLPLRVADQLEAARRLAPGGLSEAEHAAALVRPVPPPAAATAVSASTGRADARGDHVGAARCAPCHHEAYDLWSASSHRGTLTLATAASLPPAALRGDLTPHPPGATLFQQQDGGLVARTFGEDGALHDYALTHAAGARRIQMLVATLPDGRLQVLPSMRELPDGPWFDYTHLLFAGPGADPAVPPRVEPGDPSFWTGPVRSFDSRCATCHASGREPREPGPGGTGPRSTWRALGVDCEACHGPGRAHAEAWERLDTGAPLLRLETLDRAGKVAACTQCHIEGERLTAHAVVGEDLFEHLEPTLLLDPDRVDPYGRPLELIYDGLPFGISRCAEQGGLTCSHCHAPHGSPLRSLLRQSLDDGALCASCHADVARDAGAHAHHAAGGAGSRCIACHMPFLTIERGHGRVADHTLGIPDPALEGDRVSRDACTACHAGPATGPAAGPVAGLGGAPALEPEALRSAYRAWWPQARPHPWQRAIAAARLGEAGAERLLVPLLEDRGALRLVRASAARLLGRLGEAGRAPLLAASHDADGLVRRAALTALAALRGPDVDARLLAALSDPSRAVRVAAARAALEGFERVQANADLLQAALPMLASDAQAVPDDDQRWFRLAAAQELAGDVRAALASYQRQLALDPFAENTERRIEQLRARVHGAAPR